MQPGLALFQRDAHSTFVTLRHRIRFYQQLAVLARAGVPLRTSLQRLKERIAGREIDILSKQIGEGEQIGTAFAKAGFSPFECHLVNAGERSARLETVFQHLSEFWSRQLQMFQAFTSQLYYPLVVLHIAVFVGALLDSLMSGSVIVFAVTLVERFAFFYTAGFVIFMLASVSWQSEAAQRFWLGLPIIGRTLSTAYAYRWITALRLEYSAGIPMPDAVADAWQASGYAGRDQWAKEGRQALLEGGELSLLVQGWKQLPRDWVDFIETGEVSGALETAFENLEAEAARAWQIAQQRMTDWVPKIVYFIILLIVAAQIGFMTYKLTVQPINEIEKALQSVNGG